MKNENKIWTRDFTLATLSGLFAALILYIMMTTLAEFATSKYGVSTNIAGLVASIYVVGAVIGRIVCGYSMDRIGRRRVVILGCCLFFLTSLLYLLEFGVVPMLALRVVHGFFFGVIHTALSTVVIDFIPLKRRGEGIALFSLNFVVATALGPLIGLTVTKQYSYTVLFVICAVFALLCLALALPIKIAPSAGVKPSQPQSKTKFSLNNIFEKKAIPLALMIIVMSFCYAGVTAYIALYALSKGQQSIASIFFIVYAVCIVIIRPLAGKLLDRRGDNIVMIPSIICFAASLLLLGFAGNDIAFILSGVLMAFGYGNILNMGQAIAIKHIPQERVGVATSTYFVFSDTGMGIGPLVLGLIAGAYSYGAMYVTEAVIVCIGLVIYLLLHGMRAGKPHV